MVRERGGQTEEFTPSSTMWVSRAEGEEEAPAQERVGGKTRQTRGERKGHEEAALGAFTLLSSTLQPSSSEQHVRRGGGRVGCGLYYYYYYYRLRRGEERKEKRG